MRLDAEEPVSFGCRQGRQLKAYLTSLEIEMSVILSGSFNSDGSLLIAAFNSLGSSFWTERISDGRTLLNLSQENSCSARFMGYRKEETSSPPPSLTSQNRTQVIRPSSLMMSVRQETHSLMPRQLSAIRKAVSELQSALEEKCLIGFGQSSPSTNGRNVEQRGLVDLNVRS